MKNAFALILLAVAALGFVAMQKPFGKKSTGTTVADGLSVGDIAPDFSLPNVDGKLVSLASTKDANGSTPKGYIVVFTCNTCPYAVMYEDRIIELHQKMSPKGWPVVAIQPNDPDLKPGDGFEEMKVRASEKKFQFAYLLDDGQKISPQYGATKTPHFFLLDANRKVRYIGALDDNAQDADAVKKRYVENAISAIEAGKEPDPASTKAIGCGIKSK